MRSTYLPLVMSSVRAVARMALTLLGVTIAVFLIVRQTGDPAAILLPINTPPEVIAHFREAHGLDRGLIGSFIAYLGDIVHGQLGDSIRYQTPVTSLIFERAGATLELGLTALAMGAAVALPLGILGALRPGSLIDNLGRWLAVLGQSVPVFYSGTLLIFVFGVQLGLLPTVGTGGWEHLVLPASSMSLFVIPLLLRVTRSSILEQQQQDFIRTARAKGLSPTRVLTIHVMRNAMIPIVTVLGLQFGYLLGGAVITEAVFGWPGIGQLLVNAISTRDFPVVQGITLFAAFGVIAINQIVDVIYALLDPRIRR
ncbi:ABC transporter permease [Streptosporangium sp. NBC_01755]|uniref:ABC transporter permease n=1 Tax=unclassified Streptosporangium TaxID=2632669 RepID=UPI002DD9223C|nr:MULTISPECIES: ABC transporter permease [unclassified Streptosporangium]WSA28772.1 ABC transporter permease [Streptosporangium sp. NBC_01810]WSC99775.1 ABC transporter permease [Streptosporangium sp. NBC_01755]